MSSFALKLIAMITMLIDHVGFKFMNSNNLMCFIGRVAFILYAFLIAEAYNHLREKPERLKVHMCKLVSLCLISEVPYDLFEHNAWADLSSQNVLATLLLGFLALLASEAWNKRWDHFPAISFLGCIAICVTPAFAAYFIQSDYKFAGVLLIIMFYFYLQRADNLRFIMRSVYLTVLLIIYTFIYIWARANFGSWNDIIITAKSVKSWIGGTFFAMIPIALYNRSLGYRSKWFDWLYSVFYPLQFVVLIIIYYILLVH